MNINKKPFFIISSLLIIFCLLLITSNSQKANTVAKLSKITSKIKKTNQDNELLTLQAENLQLQQTLLSYYNQNRQLNYLLSQTTNNPKPLTLSPIIPAQVVFKDPTGFSGYFWINVGSKDNHLSQPIVCINSPVIVGLNLVGLIDFVGENMSRVITITNPNLKIAIKICNGNIQNILMNEKAQFLLHDLSRNNIPINSKEKETLTSLLKSLITKLNTQGNDINSAHQKGFIQGSGNYINGHSLLVGNGFHYNSSKITSIKKHTIQEHDLLITSGMDGIFPEGLFVGKTSKVFAQINGSCFCEFEATPTCGNPDLLHSVIVCSPLNSIPLDNPNAIQNLVNTLNLH